MALLSIAASRTRHRCLVGGRVIGRAILRGRASRQPAAFRNARQDSFVPSDRPNPDLAIEPGRAGVQVLTPRELAERLG
jgi:hypothetical protein